MRDTSSAPANGEVYSTDEVARAAGVPQGEVRAWVDAGRISPIRGFVLEADAVWLVKQLKRGLEPGVRNRAPLTLLPERKRRSGASLVASGVLHALLLALFAGLAALGFLNAADTDQLVSKATPVRLVYMMSPGPGGGGGGGGLQMPAPPPPAKLKAPEKKKVSSPVPPVRKVVPPRPIAPPVEPKPQPVAPQPIPVAPAPPPPAVQAPVVPIASDPIDVAGLPSPKPAAAPPSSGPGTGGGVGSGAGTGLGEGRGSGIGPGSGGGTGGGPFQPGSGLEPPVLLREVKPLYTDEARRRAIEGDVVLEIVVRQDGSVGNVRVTHSLGAGLEQKAIDAVRQWRFGPARRRGAPVDVVVEVSVGFKLR
jgi:TonB family protein